jgi:hypothetical protein
MEPMLELPSVRQPQKPVPPRAYRRIFANREFTLHVWYDNPSGSITEFHIFSGITRTGRISWSARTGLRSGSATERGHFRIAGAGLVPGFDLQAFREAVSTIDRDVRDFVLARLRPDARGASRFPGGLRTHM